MSLSTILDVLIGMALIFAVLSAAAAAIQEAIAKILATRADNLMKTLEKELGASTLAGLEGALATLGVERVRSFWRWFSDAPGRIEYVPRDAFAAHLLALAAPVLRGEQHSNVLPPALVALVDAARNDADALKSSIETWANNVLDSASRSYARYAHISLFAIGLFLSAWFDISAVRMADFLWHNETARTVLVQKAAAYAPPATPPDAAAQEIVKQLYTTLASDLALPLREGPWQAYLPTLVRPVPAAKSNDSNSSWFSSPLFDFPSGLTLFGWFLSAAATVLGAKYWFDAIQSLMRFKPKSA